MSGTTDELSKIPAASNEEDLISEMLSQQNIDALSMRMMRLQCQYVLIVERRAAI